MTDTPRQTDLFGDDTPVFDFDFEKPLYEPAKPMYTKESIREMLTGLIAELKDCDTLPWDAKALRENRAMAPYMAEWLKNGEGDRLLAEFRGELVRLGEEPVHRRELYE